MQLQAIKYSELNKNYVGTTFRLMELIMDANDNIITLSLEPSYDELSTLVITGWNTQIKAQIKPKEIIIFELALIYKDGMRKRYYKTEKEAELEREKLMEITPEIEKIDISKIKIFEDNITSYIPE